MIIHPNKPLLFEQLVPYEHNAKLHPPDQIARLAASIREHGLVEPIIVDENFSILAGHGRYLACQKLEIKELDCIVVEGLTEQEKSAYRIADNTIALESGLDPSKLGLELANLAQAGLDLSFYGLKLHKTVEERSADVDTTEEKKESFDNADEKPLVFYFFPSSYDQAVEILNHCLKANPTLVNIAGVVRHLLNCERTGVYP